MKQRRLLRFHGLRRPRIRQTWNKYNLFNLMRQRTPYFSPKTFFQQKWIAKALTRGYHGEHIKENQWERMFSRRPLSAINMDPAYMARHDGSEQAAGRGSGLALKSRFGKVEPVGRLGPRNKGNLSKPTPYMQMVFAPMERRLDISIFRALFASSARQARQFVIHGAVTVNGKKMTHPSYLLNPGDMFQVDIDRVMMATGRPKKPISAKASSSNSEPVEAEAEAEAETEEASTETAEATDKEHDASEHKAALLEIKNRAKAVMSSKNRIIRAKHKQALRQFIAEVKEKINATNKQEADSAVKMRGAEKELVAILDRLTLTAEERAEKKKKEKRLANYHKKNKKNARKTLSPEEFAKRYPEEPKEATTTDVEVLKPSHRSVLRQLVSLERENPHDSSKPYATPWKPREWMSPFAFIPRYLEVNQRICAAVYLRHPVARPGRSEVPSPFSPVVSQLAFNWYLRRS